MKMETGSEIYKDDDGHVIPLQVINGVFLPPLDSGREERFDPDVFRKMPNTSIREDDVIICTFPRSGTHWMFEICQILIRGKLDTSGSPDFLKTMLEVNTSTDLDKLSSPRVLFTHMKFEHLPREVFQKRPKMVYVARNPKDVLVSIHQLVKRMVIRDSPRYMGNFRNHMKIFVEGKIPFGSWFDHTLGWENVITTGEYPIHFCQYEHLKNNCTEEFKKLSKFLGLNRSDDFIKQVVDFCDFKEMKYRYGCNEICESDKQSVFYRKGDVGDWKNWFTVTDNEWFDAQYQKKMASSNFHFHHCPYNIK